MSWNIERSDGVGGMAPSEGQPYMSHEQLLSNRDGETDPQLSRLFIVVDLSLFSG